MRKYSFHPGLLALIILLLLIIITTQCIEEYDPNISVNENLLVVNGSIIRGNERQSIILSKSTSINFPGFIAIEECNVFVTDDKDNVFQFEEESPGRYHANIESTYLDIGAKFKLTLETPNNQVYQSGYEEIYDSPSIDSLYFIEETSYSDQRRINENGVRLNVDVYAKEGFTDYYRWKMHETYESRSSNAKIDKILVGVKDEFETIWKYDSLNSEYVLDRAVPFPEFDYFNKPDTFHICYLDSEVEEVVFSGTSNIVSNSRKRVPLHFIPNGVKLSFRYSCLVSQYSLSEGAYNYWQNKVAEIEESGGMYNTQPSQNLSNIKNINDDQETVLGYFWVSASKEKRVFFEGPYLGRVGCSSSERFNVENFYEQNPDSTFGVFRFIDTMYSPVYIINGNTYPPSCFDCRFSGGTLDRPDFWRL
ncbi:MAG: DUF4249 domain-containing protein [Bacteroidales bacterium]